MRIFAGMKKYRITERDYLKAHRKARREEEIDRHDRPVRIGGVKPSKKRYDRKREKAVLKKLPFFVRQISCGFVRTAAPAG